MRRVLFAAGLLLLTGSPSAWAQTAHANHLDLQLPQLTRCSPDVSPTYFRMFLNTVTSDGQPAGVAIQGRDLTKILHVSEGGREHRVVYAATQTSGTLAGSKGTYIVLLLDTSGSMNNPVRGARETRFEVARGAIRQALNGFSEGQDQLAVAPFDSHDVVDRIKSATSHSQTTRADVERQVDAIPKPKPINDTALYSAVSTALDVLKERRDDGYAVSLVVFSDGENDVPYPAHGNDAGLLGADGLETVQTKAGQLKVPIFTVGFGVNSAAAEALRKIAGSSGGRYYDAESNTQLTEVLQATRQKLADRIQILFGPVRASKDELSGRPVPFSVTLETGGGTLKSLMPAVWQPPGTASPVAETDCLVAEQRAIEAVAGPPPKSCLGSG